MTGEAQEVIDRVSGLVRSRPRMLRKVAVAHRLTAAELTRRAAEHLRRAAELEAELDRGVS